MNGSGNMHGRGIPLANSEFNAVCVDGAEFSVDRPPKLRRPFSRLLKRSFDVLISVPVVLGILPFLCILVKVIHLLQSPGPLFYRQIRCGRDGHPFRIVKFRTMNVPPDGESDIGVNAQERIFPLGHLLRLSKIDEFPQFINVLSGAMSVVGPRPHHYDDCELFSVKVQDYPQRMVAKPGITGLAQYTEYRGKFAWNCVRSRVEADLKYIRRWSLLLDAILIAKTAGIVVRRVVSRCFGSRQTKPAVVPLSRPVMVEAPESSSEPKNRRAA